MEIEKTRPVIFRALGRIVAVLALALVAGGVCSAERTCTVTGEFTYYGDDNTSPKEAKRLALEGARLAAIAREFGTTVTQSVVNDEGTRGGKEDTFFRSLSETEVKGEWISDQGEPQYKVEFDTDGNIMVTCRVKGLAREISNKAADFEVAILRNGADMRYADTRFRSGDDMRIYFKAPQDGYLAVYLTGEDRMAYTILPYSSSPDGCIKVKHGKEYVFLDPALADREHGDADPMQLVTDQSVERDRFYILFSPKPFVKANDNFTGERVPRSLPFNEFHKWLTRTMKNDPHLGRKTIDVVINGVE